MSITTISPKRLHEITQTGQNVEVIDVRTPAEFREAHLSFAHNIPLHQLTLETFAEGRSYDPLYVICQSGGRGKQACEKLLAAGYSNVLNVEGGLGAWIDAGLPVVRGKKAISLERQVRIAAGIIVLVSALLGYFAHPYWIALSAFVGAGLVLSGVTDTCGMGMLLARMPWNRVCKSDSKSGASGSCGLSGCA
jgi:rhodanese-related sulfurtransferase